MDLKRRIQIARRGSHLQEAEQGVPEPTMIASVRCLLDLIDGNKRVGVLRLRDGFSHLAGARLLTRSRACLRSLILECRS